MMSRYVFVLLAAAAIPITTSLRQIIADAKNDLMQQPSQAYGPLAQTGDADCGPTCVRNVLRLSGEDVSKEEIYAEYSKSHPYNGTTMTTIGDNEQVLKDHGFRTHVCLNAYMAQEWLVAHAAESYIIWYVREEGKPCNHFVLSTPGVPDTVANISTSSACDSAKNPAKCKQKYRTKREELSKWVYYDPWMEGVHEEYYLQSQTIDAQPWGQDLLDAYVQGYAYNPNKDPERELFAAIIAWKPGSRSANSERPPCPETAWGKDYALPQKPGCARTRQTA